MPKIKTICVCGHKQQSHDKKTNECLVLDCKCGEYQLRRKILVDN
jgi:hypothetical protein